MFSLRHPARMPVAGIMIVASMAGRLPDMKGRMQHKAIIVVAEIPAIIGRKQAFNPCFVFNVADMAEIVMMQSANIILRKMLPHFAKRKIAIPAQTASPTVLISDMATWLRILGLYLKRIYVETANNANEKTIG